jgi:hypothetical protein
VTSGPVNVFSVGAEVRYQARFFREQILVPVVGYAYEGINYRLTYATGATDGHGPVYGVWLLLNQLEPDQAAEAYMDSGVIRSYLVAEARNLEGGNEDIDFSGFSYFLGLRIEF